MRKLLRSLLGSSLLLATPLALSAPSVVELQTNLGTITIQLDYVHAPITANNFINYVNSGFYKGTIFHRVIKGFMMQGGGFSSQALRSPIVNEASNGLSNLAGTIAMARTKDPNSATSQFFINFVDNKFLDYRSANNPDGYAVFGKVITPRSMVVVRKVEGLPNFSDVAFTATSSLVTVDAVYTSDRLVTSQSVTRISLKGLGTVVSVPAGINCGSSCAVSQAVGSPLSLKATAAVGYYFTGWQGDCGGTRNTINLITLHGNHNCTAVFSPLGGINQ